MGSISLNIPQIGLSDTTEDVKVANNFTTLQTAINGSLDSTNLNAAAAITRAQTAGGLGGLAWTVVSSNTSATDGHFYGVTAAATITLPTPTVNATIGVFNQTVSSAVAITASSGVIGGVGLGPSGSASIQLSTGASALVVIADGANWHIVAGQQDTGWAAITLTTNASATGAPWYSPQVRTIGDRVYLRGAITTPATATTTLTLPASAVPASQVGMVLYDFATGGAQGARAFTGGTISIGGTATHVFVFDGVSYSLV